MYGFRLKNFSSTAARYQIQVQERVEEKSLVLKEERAVAVEKVETLQVIRQVANPTVPWKPVIKSEWYWREVQAVIVWPY